MDFCCYTSFLSWLSGNAFGIAIACIILQKYHIITKGSVKIFYSSQQKKDLLHCVKKVHLYSMDRIISLIDMTVKYGLGDEWNRTDVTQHKIMYLF